MARVFRVLRSCYPGAGLLLAAGFGWTRPKAAPVTLSLGQAPREILVIRLDALGDLIMSTSIFRALKESYPLARVTAVVQRSSREIIETNPFIDQVIGLPPIKRSILFGKSRCDLSIARFYWKSLRGKHFDLAIQPRLGPDYFGANLLLMLVNASCRVNYEDALQRGPLRQLTKLAYRSITSLPKPELQHEVRSNTAFTRSLTGRAGTTQPEVFLTDEDWSQAGHLLPQEKDRCSRLCVAFGAQARRRIWPLERWAETIALIARDCEVSVLVLCSRAELPEGERLRLLLSAIPQLKIDILSGVALRQVASCIASCDLLLGADSGLAHLSAAVGCASVIVSPHPADGDPYHENSPVRFRPYSDRARVLQPATSRHPCQFACDAIDPHCILEVMPIQVAQAATETLSVRDSSRRLRAKDQAPRTGALTPSFACIDAAPFPAAMHRIR